MPVDEIVRSKRRTLTIQIKDNGRVIVRAPLLMPEKIIRATIEKHHDWIISRKKRQKSIRDTFPPKRFADGERFYFKGEKFPLVLDDDADIWIRFEQAFITSPGNPDRIRNEMVEWYRREAETYLKERIHYFAGLYNLKWDKLGISSARRRWGSCSRNGAINFSWRLLMCPPEIIDYVVVHELAHLKELNHSPRFWREVELMCPKYRHHRHWLRHNAVRFSAF